jgi:hypothetical protein
VIWLVAGFAVALVFTVLALLLLAGIHREFGKLHGDLDELGRLLERHRRVRVTTAAPDPELWAPRDWLG